jgi:hypothetical protein
MKTSLGNTLVETSPHKYMWHCLLYAFLAKPHKSAPNLTNICSTAILTSWPNLTPICGTDVGTSCPNLKNCSKPHKYMWHSYMFFLAKPHKLL